jgi:hypothetical protein
VARGADGTPKDPAGIPASAASPPLSSKRGSVTPLKRAHYDLRAHDGTFICYVTREKAEAGIADGSLELRYGAHGVDLRPARGAR